MAELTIDQILSLLAENQALIFELTAGLTSAQLLTPPAPGEWSLNNILSHLRSCADVWGKCIRTIAAEDLPTIKAVDPRTWIKSTDYPNLDFQISFQAFTAQRNELLSFLKNLSPGDWSRSATVTGAGRPLPRTVQFYARWLVKHERTHVKQIKRIVMDYHDADYRP